DPLKSLLSKLERFRTELPQEKIHLHFDKPYYTIGDSIWFKAYVVNAEQNRPSQLGRILYVELINDKDSIKKSLRLPLIAGLGWGDFTLSDSLKEGNYRVRAYTNWMRNFGNEYFFDKVIRIGNSLSNTIITDTKYTFSKAGINEKVLADINYSDLKGEPIAGKEVTYNIQLNFRNIATGKGVTDDKGNLKINFVNNQPFILKSGKITTTLKLGEKTFISKIIPVKSTSDEVDVQFFPESGQMVNSIRSKIGFKAVKADGLSADVSGYITDKDNNKITEFKAQHAGMGTFELTPAAGNSYKAVVKFNDGSEKSFDLPKSAQSGYVLSVDTAATNDNIRIKISTSPDIYKSGGDITLIAQTNHVIQYVSKTKLSSPVLSTILSKKRFPTGILQLTLFSSDNRPVAERLVFIQKNDQLKINVSTNSPSYKKREKVQMTFNVTDAEGKPVQGNFSLAVTDEKAIPYDETYETTIFSNLLLTSDLKGYIEAPDYYFSGINETKLRQLDNLMLTQGWRRFLWRNLLLDVYPAVTFLPEHGIEISGKVYSANGLPVAGGKVNLLASRGKGFNVDTLTDMQGVFRFNNLYFTESTQFVIHARNEKGKDKVYIDLFYNRPPLVTANQYANDMEVNVNQSILSYLKTRQQQFDEMRENGMLKNSIMLAEVKVSETKPKVITSYNLNGPGNADAVVRGDQLKDCNYLVQCLDGKINGVVFQGGVPYLFRNLSSNRPMLVLLNGSVINPSTMSNIPVAEVDNVEALKTAGTTSMYGIRGGGGVLLINMKKRQFDDNPITPGTASYNDQGYYISRQFYSPNYSDPKNVTAIADRRTTIYWNPTIITDTNGKGTVEFFNADGLGNYKAVIEGINDSGKLGRQVYRYTVQ
ncbi:MAG TPA: TonB-dependent receptor, partial [Sphingobacteriaceae bacterium]|nr:TonB-dependent receptor [Sphingobacteriaceae bacterium]